MIVVVDTSVYVSALVFGGLPAAALDRVLRPPYRLAVSAELEAELTETLVDKFKWPGDRVQKTIARLWVKAARHQPANVRASRDPQDDHVLGCAIAAGAQFLITGDKDLLILHPHQGIVILTPARFLAVDKAMTGDFADEES